MFPGLPSWPHIAVRPVVSLALPLLAAGAAAQNVDVAGKWLLALEYETVTDYGILEIADAGGELQVFIDGGPVNLLNLDENRIVFDFDWTDSADRLRISELSGEHLGERMSGSMTEGGEPTGNWSAEPWSEHPQAGADPAPLDLSGVWSSVSRGTHKDAFDLTPAGAAINDAYDATLDDPTVWISPWTYSVPMQRLDQPLYEYACHEGNYGIYNILAGAVE